MLTRSLILLTLSFLFRATAMAQVDYPFEPPEEQLPDAPYVKEFQEMYQREVAEVEQHRTVVIRNVNVLHNRPRGKWKRHRTVVIRKDNIRRVRPTWLPALRRDARVLDRKGQYLIPGLVDAHTHMSCSAFDRLLLLEHGVTTYRTMDRAGVVEQEQELIRSGVLLAPQVVSATGTVHGMDYPSGNWPPKPTEAHDFFFLRPQSLIWSHPARLEALLNSKAPLVVEPNSPLQLAAAMRQGHLMSIEKTGALLLPLTTSVDSLERGIELVRQAKVPLVPCIVATNLPVDYAELYTKWRGDSYRSWISIEERRLWAEAYLSGSLRGHERMEALKAYHNQLIWLTSRLIQEKVRLAVGTESGIHLPFVIPGRAVHDEMDLLVAAGLTPRGALLAATQNGALALGLEKEIGKIRHGYQADLLILKEDPLQKLEAARFPEELFLRGIHLDAEEMQKLKEGTAIGR